MKPGPARQPPESRFWPKVDRSGGPDACWPWTAARRHGYGVFGLRAGDIVDAHRVAWRFTRGPIPDGLCVLHHCDNKLCVNPAHLYLGTEVENQHDRCRRGRRGPKLKLTEFSVRLLRGLRARGASFDSLGRAFRIHPRHAARVCRGQFWSFIR